MQISPRLARAEFIAEFGNRKIRLVARPGDTVFRTDAVARDGGSADEVAPDADQHDVAELPPAVLCYLNPTRCCDSDALAEFAWTRLGGVTPG